MVADDLSKIFDTFEYKLSRNYFGMLSQNFGPFCLDLFASPTSYLFKPFCSRFLCKESVAVDAFTIDWGSLNNGFLPSSCRFGNQGVEACAVCQGQRGVDRPCVGIS